LDFCSLGRLRSGRKQPTKFELVINLKTAKALGLTISNQMQFAGRQGGRMNQVLLRLLTSAYGPKQTS
jgi:hypothetical protein